MRGIGAGHKVHIPGRNTYERCTEDIRRIGLACAAFGKLDKNVEDKKLKTKMKLYTVLCAGASSMYGSEYWTLRKEDEKILLVAEMEWLRRIRGRSRREN